jgi:hypothetical protein
MFDTQKFVKQLEASGVPPARAEVMIDVFRSKPLGEADRIGAMP